MSKTQFVDFAHVKKSVSILQILEHYQLADKLKRSGDSLSGPCPIHEGDNPTQFRVSLSKNCWNCFGKCQGGGNILDFVSKKEGVSIRQAALLIQRWFGLESPKASAAKQEQQAPAPAKKPTEANAEAEDSTANPPLRFRLEHLDAGHAYLTERELTPETIATFGLGFCNKGILAGRIAIPIHNAAGQLVAYAGRWPGEPPEGQPKYKLPKGFRKSLELFNFHRANAEPQEKPLVIVEGFFDAMRLWQCGLRRVVALMGSSLSTAQEKLIRENTTSWGQALILLDEDEAGRAGRDEIVRRLSCFLWVKVHVFLTDGMQPDRMSPDEVEELFGGAA